MENEKLLINKYWIDDILEKVYKYYNKLKVVLWGKYSVSEIIREKLWAKYGIEVAFYVDKDNAKIDNECVFSASCLYGNSSKYYVVILVSFCQSLRKEITGGGYTEDSSYCYLSNCITQKEYDYYEDAHGNKVIGVYEGLKFVFQGFDSVIKIGKNVHFKNTNIYVNNNSNVLLGDNIDFIESTINIEDETIVEVMSDCKIQNLDMGVGTASSVLLNRGITIIGEARWNICKYSKLEIGDRGRFSNGSISLGINTLLKIGNDFSIGYQYNFVLYEQTSIFIGEDCMFSYDIYLRSNDGHSIFDIKTGKNINTTNDISKSRKIIIGNHVWIGMRSTILYNSIIGDGTIIGASSLVKGTIPNNCIAAGVAAKVIKTDIAWSRKLSTEDILECGKEYIRLTE